jgi:hypothetical protein
MNFDSISFVCLGYSGRWIYAQKVVSVVTIDLAFIFVGETYWRKPYKPFNISSNFTTSSSSYSNITSNRMINQEEINIVFFF